MEGRRGGNQARIDFSRALLMDERADESACQALAAATRQLYLHMRTRPHPLRFRVEEVGYAPGPTRANVVDTIHSRLGDFTPDERDAWLAATVLSNVAVGIAHARGHDSVEAGDVDEAKRAICLRWPECGENRIHALAHSALIMQHAKSAILE